MGCADKSYGTAAGKMLAHVFVKDFVPMVDDGTVAAGKPQPLGF
jgi:beta-phosphoglucomutase-like phosphatase (HAD superfamily)